MKLNNSNLKKIETLLKECGFVIRYEKGNFNSGYCILESKKVIVINKYYTTEAKVGTLLEILGNLKLPIEKMSEPSKVIYSKIAQLKIDNF